MQGRGEAPDYIVLVLDDLTRRFQLSSLTH
jgi:hypothetical protein